MSICREGGGGVLILRRVKEHLLSLPGGRGAESVVKIIDISADDVSMGGGPPGPSGLRGIRGSTYEAGRIFRQD